MPFSIVRKEVKSLFKSGHSKSMKQTPFRHWAIAFVVCNFNVDLGPEIELVYPADTHFSKADLTAICFNSFPETQDTDQTDPLVFHFTIPNTSPDIPLVSPCTPHGSASELYGSCYFRQEFDHTTKRSFNQKTLVLISNHNFPAFFTKLLELIVGSGVINDPAALEAAVRQIDTWPPPSVGRHALPFLGNVLQVEIAPHASFALQGLPPSAVSSPVEKVSHVSVTDPTIYVYGPLGSWQNNLLQYLPSLSELYMLFEKLILCESVVVLAKSPQVCSEFVSSVLDLIRPVPYAGLVRPYLIMQSDFNTLGQDGSLPRNFLIGITNPFLLKRITSALEKSNRSMPHIVYLDRSEGAIPLKSHGVQLPPGVDIPGGSGGLSLHRSGSKRIKTDTGFTRDLTAFQKSLSLASATHSDIDSLIRRQFAELAAQFLAPINRYLQTSLASDAFTPGGNPKYGNFNEADFLKSLSKHGTALEFKERIPVQRHRSRDAFYEAFCRSPNFYAWMEMKLSLEKEASAGMLNEPRKAYLVPD